MPLTLYEASAGSGKTYTIVKEYLAVLFNAYDPSHPENLERSLRATLAITFTNKAAAEMKERVLHALKRLSEGDHTLYPEFWQNYPHLSEMAYAILTFLLHHYQWFTITTIDSFIQKLSRSIAFELDIPLAFQTLLDKSSLFKDILNDILEQFGQDTTITMLLEDFITTQLSHQSSLSLELQLLNQATTIYQEKNYNPLLPVLEEINQTPFYHEVKKNYHALQNQIQQEARQILQKMQQENIEKENILYKGAGNVSFIEKLAKGNIEEVNHESSRLYTWTNKKTPNHLLKKIVPFFETYVAPFLKKYHIHPDNGINDMVRYYAYNALIDHLFSLTLMNIFQKELQKKIRIHQLIPIEEFTRRLHDKISKQNAIPYLYMRLGETYRYFFIDEFQDTSRLQWENLLPLIEEALSQNGHTYLVGDPKQSIYRWRNGDVRIMLQDVRRQFPNFTHTSLDTNYRSYKTIVEFVNTFFSSLVTYIKNKTSSSSTSSTSLFLTSYTNITQKYKDQSEGMVSLDFEFVSSEKTTFQSNEPITSDEESPIPIIEEDDIDIEEETETEEEKLTQEWCIYKIKKCLESGYRYQDIAILVRTNKHASFIAEGLLKENIPFISGEALFVANSPAIQLLIASMNLLLRPTEKQHLITFLELTAFLFEQPLEQTSLENLFSSLSSSLEDLQNQLNSEHPVFQKAYSLIHDRLFLFTLSLYDLTEELIRRLHLHTLQSQYIFLAKFLDTIQEFSLQSRGSLADFLEEWEKLAQNLTLDPDESADAVRILTVHKAKGLEFPVVLFPILPQKKPSNVDIVGNLPLNTLPELSENASQWKWLYKHKKNLSYVPELKTIYEEEKDLSLLDEINILYVAFTRPKEVFCAYIPLRIIKNKSKFQDFSQGWETCLQQDLETFLEKNALSEKIGHLILFLLSQQTKPTSLHAYSLSYQQGSWPQKTPSSTSNKNIHANIMLFPSTSWQKKLRVRQHEAEIHLLFHETQRIHREEGIILHELLSHVFSEEDIPEIVENYAIHLPGNLTPEAKSDLIKVLSGIWHIFSSRGWTENYRIYNEETLLTPQGLIRPDKIFLNNDRSHAVIIDYKSGLQTEEQNEQTIIKRYSPQLNAYCRAIASMGYSHVEGYILFVTNQKIFQVVSL
ncbi:UvrD-helicase domain-containing protein [Thermospira aquatica]|uniref:DNA 3'-5' helicase n=1 Tax=Thermospira aquatica TaxID=2828656 RepID=A0AAX3BF88_9SPIR|nr:UvrD-helicase domain-containing protein [Thermospira aquatica]URA10935.1 UvrD-helicase domain-containing protein [Thermospira aquatica]